MMIHLALASASAQTVSVSGSTCPGPMEVTVAGITPNGSFALVTGTSGGQTTAMTAGQFQTCAVLDDGSLKCWGHNGYGQLGLGDTANRGDGPWEMGNHLPAVDVY